MESYKKIYKASGLFGSAQGFSILLNLVRTKLVALLLGPTGIGLNSIYNETRELMHSASNLGMDVSGIRGISQSYELWLNAESEEEKRQRKSRIEEEICLLRSWVLILAMFGTLICMLLAEPISYLTFKDLEHTWNYVLLSPVIGLSTMICGELAVLKAMRCLKTIASVSVVNVILAIITTIPLYYFWGIKGIIPAFILLYISQLLIITWFSYRIQPPSFSFNRQRLANGLPMLVLGVSFALTGMINHGAQLSIRTFINHHGGIELVGLFNAGYTIFSMLGSIAFASLDSYFFPQLSGIFSDVEQRRKTIFRQVKVTLSIILPVILIIAFLLEWLIPLLFSHDFDPVIPMARIAIAGLCFRAIYLPLAYLPLSAGDSKIFLCLELLSAIILTGSVITGFYYYNLMGAGIGLLISTFSDMCISLIVAKTRYKL